MNSRVARALHESDHHVISSTGVINVVQAALDDARARKRRGEHPAATAFSVPQSQPHHAPGPVTSSGPMRGTASHAQAPLQQLLGLSHQFRIAALTNASQLLPTRVFASFLVFSSGLEDASAHLAQCLDRDAPESVKVTEFGPLAAPTVE